MQPLVTSLKMGANQAKISCQDACVKMCNGYTMYDGNEPSGSELHRLVEQMQEAKKKSQQEKLENIGTVGSIKTATQAIGGRHMGALN